MLTALILAAAWLIPATISYGLLLAYFQRQFPWSAKGDRISDVAFCAAISLFTGPISLVSTLVSLWGLGAGLKHGLLFWPKA